MPYSINNKLYLASKSPRRAELLDMIDIAYQLVDAPVEEYSDSTIPKQIVLQISEQKAKAAADILPSDSLILSADTLVFLGDRIIGKPKDKKDAFEILRSLSNNTHFVCTGMTLAIKDRSFFMSACEKSIVHVGSITDEEITEFVESGIPMDKSGAYAIQSKFASYIKGIEGCYYNIMGLPIHRLHRMLKELEALSN